MSAEVDVRVMPETDARRLTEKIRITAHTYAEAREKLIGYVEEARAGNAHLALGYASWTAYLADVLGEEPMRLARDERREVVQLLAGEGMSTRAIAPIVGSSFKTVARDLASPVSSDTPGSAPSAVTPDDAPAVDLANVDLTTGEILDHPAPRPVTGMDGKTYTRPEPRAPQRRALPDQFFDAAYDLTKAVEKVARISEDDRFPQNAEKVAAKHRSDLTRARDLLQEVINRLPAA